MSEEFEDRDTQMGPKKIVTYVAPVNIAVIKYWGKRDEDRILPINDSLSLTLDWEEMGSTTTVMTSPDLKEDVLWLNGTKESPDNPRFLKCLEKIRSISKASFKDQKISIVSNNNFPTAAGLASSAAGYACLVSSLCHLFQVDADRSALARLGSGSACRSVLGGFVRWYMGCEADGSDSLAKTVFPPEHWSEIEVLICVVSDSRKKVPSSKGMRNGVLTSQLLDHRARNLVPKSMQEILHAIQEKNFHNFSEIVMKDSNQLHAVCLDTHPPNVYLNDVSHSIIALIHEIGNKYGKNLACYTFDAGPNACIFVPKNFLSLIAGYIHHYFGPSNGSTEGFFMGRPLHEPIVKDALKTLDLQPLRDSLKYVIHTGIGGGPKCLSDEIRDDSIHLIDPTTGCPKGQ